MTPSQGGGELAVFPFQFSQLVLGLGFLQAGAGAFSLDFGQQQVAAGDGHAFIQFLLALVFPFGFLVGQFQPLELGAGLLQADFKGARVQAEQPVAGLHRLPGAGLDLLDDAAGGQAQLHSRAGGDLAEDRFGGLAGGCEQEQGEREGKEGDCWFIRLHGACALSRVSSGFVRSVAPVPARPGPAGSGCGRCPIVPVTAAPWHCPSRP